MRRSNMRFTLKESSSPKYILKSGIRVSAELLCTMSRLKAHLSDMPCLQQVSHGTLLKYSLIGFGGNEAATIEFGRNYVSYCSFSSASSVQRCNSDLTKLLCILAYLDGIYSVELKELYQNLIEALRSSTVHDNRSNLSNCASEQQLSSLNSMNLSLSQRLLSLHSENIGLKNKLNLHKTAVEAVIQETRRRFGDEVPKSVLAIYTEQLADINLAME